LCTQSAPTRAAKSGEPDLSRAQLAQHQHQHQHHRDETPKAVVFVLRSLSPIAACLAPGIEPVMVNISSTRLSAKKKKRQSLVHNSLSTFIRPLS
jgi:hypothetical protein